MLIPRSVYADTMRMPDSRMATVLDEDNAWLENDGPYNSLWQNSVTLRRQIRKKIPVTEHITYLFLISFFLIFVIMALVLMDEGADTILEALLNNVWTDYGASKNLILHLYTDRVGGSVTPLDTDTVAGAQYEEAVGGGYSAITLASGSWTVSTVSNIVQAAYAQQSFTFTGPLTNVTNKTVKGFYITTDHGTAGSRKIIGADSFSRLSASDFTPTNNNDVIRVTPVIQLSKGTPA